MGEALPQSDATGRARSKSALFFEAQTSAPSSRLNSPNRRTGCATKCASQQSVVVIAAMNRPASRNGAGWFDTIRRGFRAPTTDDRGSRRAPAHPSRCRNAPTMRRCCSLVNWSRRSRRQAALLQLAPLRRQTNAVDRVIDVGEQLIARGGDDALMQSPVPCLEGHDALCDLAFMQAAFHLGEIRPSLRAAAISQLCGSHQADVHHFGWACSDGSC